MISLAIARYIRKNKFSKLDIIRRGAKLLL